MLGKTKVPSSQKKRFPTTTAILLVGDFIVLHLTYFIALWVRFDCEFSEIPETYLKAFSSFITPFSAFCLLLFYFFGMYHSIWRYAGYNEVIRATFGSLSAAILHVVLITAIFVRMPLSYHLLGASLQLIFLMFLRFSRRIAIILQSGFSHSHEKAARVMIIGAGAAGQMILSDMRTAESITDKAVCIIDDNKNKWGRYLEGVPIVGGREEILNAVKKYRVDKIFITMPSAPAAEKRDIIAIANETGCELKQLPGVYQMVSGQVSISSMKNVAVEDLLGREPIKTDMKEVYSFIHDKTVLVTGGGGSIGSELCRQVAAHNPKRLVILDVYENNAYAIQFELKQKHPDLDLVVLIGSVRDSRRMLDVFETYRPQIVYHAAAHKHVPLMEESPAEAIKNNAIGTYKTAYAAMVSGAERFVLISTDKAVNPTNIMGATKRLCEMIIQSFDAKIKAGKAEEMFQMFTHVAKDDPDVQISREALKNAKTEFVAVRFGNVLGSNGSVIPLFKKQIAEGGPVTVTHPDIIRYFMTIPEAVSLVMLAGTYAHGGEIFVLDMGSPVKIDTLARNLIRLSGFKPDVDIKIEYVGLRPGEKLYEEKLMAEEGIKKTDNDLIHIGCPIPFDVDAFLLQLKELMEAAYNNRCDIKERVARIVETYHPAGAGEPAKTPAASRDPQA